MSRVREVRFDPEEEAKVEKRAAAAGVNFSEFVRARALGVKPGTTATGRRRGVKAPASSSAPSIEEPKQEPTPPPTEREIFIAARTEELMGLGRLEVVARSEADAEWRNRVRRGRV